MSKAKANSEAPEERRLPEKIDVELSGLTMAALLRIINGLGESDEVFLKRDGRRFIHLKRAEWPDTLTEEERYASPEEVRASLKRTREACKGVERPLPTRKEIWDEILGT